MLIRILKHQLSPNYISLSGALRCTSKLLVGLYFFSFIFIADFVLIFKDIMVI